VAGIIQTQSTPGPCKVQVLSKATSDDFDVAHVGVYEISEEPIERPGTVAISDTTSGQTVATSVTTLAAISGLDVIAVTPPGPGYMIEVHLETSGLTGGNTDFEADLQQDIASAGYSSVSLSGTSTNRSSARVGTKHHHVVAPAVSGSAYSYKGMWRHIGNGGITELTSGSAKLTVIMRPVG